MKEFQAAYQLSQQLFENPPLNIPGGFFAVVSESPAYCQFTDAVLPTPYRSLERICGSRRLAEYFARKANERNGSEDVCFKAWPPRPLPPIVAGQHDDDIPF